MSIVFSTIFRPVCWFGGAFILYILGLGRPSLNCLYIGLTLTAVNIASRLYVDYLVKKLERQRKEEEYWRKW